MNSSSLSNSINYSTIPSIVTDSPNAIANITAPIIAANATVRVFGLSCNGSIKYLRFDIFLLSIFASLLASTIPSSSFILLPVH